tara:strand:- start:103 stop:666 length:564 start_codon:yes stop_codon:yes gene_type:complete
MDLNYILEPNNIFCNIILDNIDFNSFIFLLKTTKYIINNLNDYDEFWYKCCIKYKNKFFWDLANMRSNNTNWLCNKNLNYKQELRNLYFYDNLLKESKRIPNDMTYYHKWITMEYYNDKFENTFNMLDYLLENYLNPNILNFRIPRLLPGRKTLNILNKNFKNTSNINEKKKIFEEIMIIIGNLFCN